MQRTHLINYMNDVQNFEKNMSDLSNKWDLLTLLGSMSNIGMDTSETRKAFEDLLDEPLKRLVDETLNKSLNELESKAQTAIDILIRNLFERTADIGFLATDDDIRDYLLFLNSADFSSSDKMRELKMDKKNALQERFREYVAKYSVYENIILLDTKGKVLVQLDSTNPISFSKDPLLEESLRTHQGYVETYRASDLTHHHPALIYSYRVSNILDDGAIGVLCLVFRFENELQSIFNKLTKENPYISIELLSSNGEVIASSSRHHVPIGSSLNLNNPEAYQTYYAGFEYLYKAVKTKGYQEYSGSGWIGHAMVPLHLAFRSSSQTSFKTNPLFDSLTNAKAYYPQELQNILKKAKKIQSELDITVWNGNAKIANSASQENPFTKALLNEISKTGEETKRVFDHTVAGLNRTMTIQCMESLKFQSSLAIDIMDRNLYERANDCRWWALTTTFRECLSHPQLSDFNRKKMGDILHYINNLYTVYSTMFIYDHEGTILAFSTPEHTPFIGKKIGYQWAIETLALNSTQEYTVSEFEPNIYYNDRSTYIYNACIRNFNNENVGGIGIVFDSESQFKSMLLDILPKDINNTVIEGMFALFTDRKGKVIASTADDISIGDTLELPDSILNLSNGESDAQIVSFHGNYYAIGATCSNGYREYKQYDGYQNDIIALMYRPIGAIQSLHEEIPKQRIYNYPIPNPTEERTEISTFFVGGSLFAVESKKVVCSLSHQELTSILHASEYNLGVISYEKRMVNIISLAKLLGMEKKYDKDQDTIILVKTVIEKQIVYLGLVVDAIYSSPEIPTRSISHYSNVLKNENSLTKAVIIPDNPEDFGNEMISILDIPKIYAQLIQPYSPPMYKVVG